ncbi:MAG: Gfo/Idh/MocA family oxidoreductase [Anaerolineales bacterium]|nr:Gfo/Idh/MocA family oxidoreductase [Anaerolineales bacterium]
MSDELLDLDYKPHMPPKTDYGIGIVGCGGIVQYAVLPTYKKHGLNVLACHDINHATAESVAAEFDIPNVYENLEELLANPAIEIVEISVPPRYQLEIARTCIAAGKHLLCQKPLADTLPHAAEIVRLAREGSVKLAVNQQLRWGQGLRAAKTLIRKGWIGQVVDASIQVSVNTPWQMWPWLAISPRLEVQYHSIHYIDAMRSILGDPIWITSRHARNPLQGEIVGETKTITVMDYDTDLQVLIADNHYNHSDDYFAVFRFIGTEGHITGTLGAMYNYPDGRPDTLQWSSTRYYPEKRFEAKLEGKWIPDAFIGPTASLMQAIQEDGVPETDGHDNLQTLRVVEAAYQSAAENRSVNIDECQAVPCPD